ncbi:MAG TPA: dihydrolipoamide acetyltransferase family protein [Nitrospiraceae bacterium]|nr:dihydrolipoamide acetyltransferase family protein [Nitrospiraceae bacterium]
MATDIVMPQLGESIAEGTVVKWLVPKGGRIEKDQPLLEVETDKVALEIPSPATGQLAEVLVQAGETVPVGTVLARLDGGVTTETGVINRVGGVVVRPAEPTSGGEEHYSPAVRQLAKEHGVDLHQVVGTGEGGRVTKKDVLAFVARREPTATPSTPPGVKREAPGEMREQDEILPLTQMRRTIAERMLKSKQAAPHVATFFEVDCFEIARFREGRSLTYLPFIISSVCRALRELPIMNSSWGDSGIVLKKDIHMGVAVALDEGLLVPVIRHADRKGLLELSKEVANLAERARSKKLAPEEVQAGTFTITNHGGFGSLFSTPIINQPQIAILGVGAVQKRAVVIHEAIAIRPMCYLSLSFDHRVIDGATADQFMAKIKRDLEQQDWEKRL